MQLSDRAKIIEELRQEIACLEAELEQKRRSHKPVMIPGLRGSMQESKPDTAELEREIEGKKNLLETYVLRLTREPVSLPKFDRNALLRPEYREGGYFTSQDYYDKCEEFHRLLAEQGETFLSLPRSEYISRKKKFFQERYGITWLAEEHQFLPGANVDVHISHPKNW